MGEGAKRSFIGSGVVAIGARILWARFSTRQGAAPRGLSLVELLVALAILALVITLPLVTMSGHRQKMSAVDEGGIAWQIIANEVELQRHRDFADLRHGTTEPFMTMSATSELNALMQLLPEPEGTVSIEQEVGGVVQVTMTLRWGTGKQKRAASLTILRSDLPGGTLW